MLSDFDKEMVEEARRRDLKFSSTCSHCGDGFVNQDLEYILIHSITCKEKEKIMCKKHPKYKAIRYPVSECPDCLKIWREKNG